jgi:hypothetical protein
MNEKLSPSQPVQADRVDQSQADLLTG